MSYRNILLVHWQRGYHVKRGILSREASALASLRVTLCPAILRLPKATEESLRLSFCALLQDDPGIHRQRPIAVGEDRIEVYLLNV